MNRKVIALVEDPFWRSKIDNAVRSVGATTVFLTDPAKAAGVLEPGAPVIIVVDLALKTPPFEAIAGLKKGKATSSIPVVGYFDMARKDLKEKALAKVTPSGSAFKRFQPDDSLLAFLASL